MRARTFPVALILAVALISANAAQAQFWEKKDYRQWSKSDCQRMLKDSPWGASYMIGGVVMETVEQTSVVPGRDSTPNVTYTAHLLSAKPVRQAMMRLQQLDPKYQRMSAEQRQAFDENAGKFIEREFSDVIVFRVEYSGSQAYMLSVERYWTGKTQEDLAQRFNLIGNKGRIRPLQVVVAGGGGREIQLIFPRNFGGELVVTPELKELRLEIGDPYEVVSIAFSVKKLMLGGELVY